MKTYPVQIVSLGSGAPDNITLKAFRVLEEVDVIVAPGSAALLALSSLENAENIMEKTVLKNCPMTRDREETLALYRNIADEISDLVIQGKKVALVTIGDASIYSTAQYVCDELNVPYIVLPGVPSFVSAAAMANSSLVRQGDNLTILSEIANATDIEMPLSRGEVVVVMKLSVHQELVREVIKRGQYSFVYAEKMGNPDEEWFTEDYAELSGRKCPYLSLIIIKPKRI
ncbi:MAG: precorrin-2 C(20)-methyltransferase [Bacteroidales bacterium]|uniref:precorrin-2 C(20)-methyltransferase n=1 Tax=Porphyromonas sp. TaxID=1924944 RepID=UPI002979D84B|nr:precorrin-2 C(20)-methyltransferase [Porphyromonas sp.]MDD7438037.1 precorrin-2 C(20)-methyltransferase [Bacteroidales bacterium]MDY3067819.1 precorrin-2 C(20)-methyltransferase [Porphyromonas sp.]